MTVKGRKVERLSAEKRSCQENSASFNEEKSSNGGNKNAALTDAKNNKKDEFYTQLTDIEKELKNYREYFENKIVLCNCDDPYESNFFKYFVLNFNHLKLKKLIATCYVSSPIANRQLSLFDIVNKNTEDKQKMGKAYKAEVTKIYDITESGGIDMNDVSELFKNGENVIAPLKGDGDFRSDECLALMDEADIVVTNPPFSLFREFISVLEEHDKKYIIIGNQNAMTYKEIFPLLKDNKIWLGYGFQGNVGFFYSPYEDNAKSAHHKKNMIRVSGVDWYTNIDIKKKYEKIILVKKYDPELYPEYDNYDAIEVSKVKNIPCDYEGVMGVPITFLNKYCPEQFKIVGCTESEGKGFSNGLWHESSKIAQPIVAGKKVYKRIFIKHI